MQFCGVLRPLISAKVPTLLSTMYYYVVSTLFCAKCWDLVFCNDTFFFFCRFCLRLETRLNLKQTWKMYLVRYCASYFHTWTKHQGKEQLRLPNFGLIWSEVIQIYQITLVTDIDFRISNEGLKIWNGIGKDGQH